MSGEIENTVREVSVFLDGNGGWIEQPAIPSGTPMWRGYTPATLRLSVIEEGVLPESLRDVMMPALIADEAFEHAATIRDMIGAQLLQG